VPPSGKQVYVTGVGESTRETWKLDPESGWTPCADMNRGRRRYCATFVDDTSMYVLGGMDGEYTILDSVEKYDVKTDTWAVVGNLKRSTCLAASAVFNGDIYVFGGRCSLPPERATLRGVQVFNTASRVCTVLPQRLPRPMQMLRAVTWNEKVIIVGKNACAVFDHQQKTFEMRNQFASEVNQFGLVLENERVYLIGGHTKVKRDDGTVTRPASDEVKSVAVTEIVNNVSPANWTHHARLPQPAFIHAFAVVSMPRQLAE